MVDPASPLLIDRVTGNPVEPQRAPNSWFGGPVVRPDGLAADVPGRSRRVRIPVLFNPLIRVLIFGLLAAATLLVGVVLLALVVPPASLTRNHPLFIVVSILCIVLAYWILARVIERRRVPVELAPGRALGLLWGLLAGAAVFVLVYGLIMLLGGFRIAGMAEVDWPNWWLQVLGVGASAGIIEEVLFRGIVFRVVEEFGGTWVAAAVSGVAFGLAHLINPNASWWGAIAIGLEAGLLFGLLYAFSRSLWVVIGFHAAWNIVQGPVFGVVLSGTGSAPSIIETTAHGADLISGGAFGAEASLVSVLVLLVFTAAVAVLLVRRRAVVAPMWVRRARQRTAATEGAPSVSVSA